jgi:hypothetical protein
VRPDEPRDPHITAFHATSDGASIAQIADLTRALDFPMEVSYRPADIEEVPIPSIAHLRPGHFAAIVGETDGRYILDDPLLGGEVWISQAALREQSSGYFLVPEGERPAGWTAPPARSLDHVRGKCGSPDGERQRCCPPGECCDGGTGGSCPTQGMAGYSFNALHAGIMLGDTPLGYAPPKGPAVPFGVQYHQRGATQPTTPTFTNMGSLWFPVWIAYIEDDPSNLLAPASLVGFGGGTYYYEQDSENASHRHEKPKPDWLKRR